MNYELLKSTASTDTKYANAFHMPKTIIEYQVPRYFILLQALYNHICEKKKLRTI
ncbi:MAG: hypothetical protein LBE09_09275 [Christensenellaceae bacterium]|jgi:hypothetical protein|nr:hypothetical protein [Christensenellaceae bacterium]